MKTKKCTKCGEILSVDNFNKNKASKSGYQSWCKECQYKRHRDYYNINMSDKKRSDKLNEKLNSLPSRVIFSDLLMAQINSGYNSRSLLTETMNIFERSDKGYYQKRTPSMPNLRPATISDYSNEQLFNELRRRGFTGKLVTKTEIEL